MALAVLVFGFGLTVQTAAGKAQGKAARRVAAEIRVVAGDLNRLRSQSGLSRQHKAGLADRIRGGIAGLAILARFADEAAGKYSPKARQFIKPLAARFKARDFGFVEEKLHQLAALYPLDLPKAVDDTKMAAALHNTYCSACHDEPDTDAERPAFKLTVQAQEQSAQEFFARLVVGVRGDRRTGLSNPFTDRELAVLFAYYRGTAATNR